jgi:hypothetical protein
MNALVMCDQKIDSLWSHFTGHAVEEDFVGTTLAIIPTPPPISSRLRPINPCSLRAYIKVTVV